MRTNRRTVLLPAILAVSLLGCGGVRRITIDTTRPAKILDRGGHVVCATTPCEQRISRETCWLVDSSSGYVIFTAVAEDGVAQNSAPMKTCDIDDGERVLITLPPAN
jgi:hypothetical protein